MAITVWYEERTETDGSHNVVSTKSGWRSECGVRREWMAVTMWFQQRVDGDHSVVSTESGWRSQYGVKREQITISV
jgi:hypothetical protein